MNSAGIQTCTERASDGGPVCDAAGARPLPLLWQPAICVDTGQVSEGTWTNLPDDPRPGISMDAPIVASLVY